MKRDCALAVAFRRLNECADWDITEYPPVLSRQPKGSSERKAFLDEFVQCFEANEDLFLAMDYTYRVSNVAYWYYAARANPLSAYRMISIQSPDSYSTILAYIVAYGLRQGPLDLLPTPTEDIT